MANSKKYKYYEISDPIYRAEISLFIGDLKEIKKDLIKKFDKKNFEDLGWDGKFIKDKDCYLIILSKFNLSTLIHELIHYCFCVLNDRGIKISLNNDEVMAYYFQMTFSNILEKLKK